MNAHAHIEAAATLGYNANLAHRLGEAGLAVFPVGANKKPIFTDSWKEAATTEAEKIDELWRGDPAAMPAIACGKSNIVVVDLDCHPGQPDGVEAFADIEEAHGRIKSVPRVKTPSGGLHLYFRQPDGAPVTNSTGELPKGIDVRGVGGYVVAPGAMLPDGRKYEPLPASPRLSDALANGGLPTPDDWLLKLIRPPRPPRENYAPRPRDDSDDERDYIEKAMDRIPSDDRSDWFRIGCALHDSGHPWAREAWDDWSRKSAKFDDAEQDKTWRSFGRGYSGPRASIGTIIALARDNGFTERKSPFVDGAPSPMARLQNGGSATMDKMLPVPGGADAIIVPPPLSAPSAATGAIEGVYFDGDAPPAPVPMLVERLLPLEGLTILAGQSGAGKSFLAIDLSVALASQGSFFGRIPEERVAVIYVAAEGRATIATRIDAAKKARGIADKLPIAVVKIVPDLASKKERAEFIQKLQLIAQRLEAGFGLRVGAVIIDTVIAAFTIKDENSAGELSQVCKAAAELGDAIGAATIPLVHFGKSQETGIRGSSATRGFGESVLAVLADRDETTGKCSNRRLVHSKSRVGEEGPIARFELRDVTLTSGVGEEFRAGCVEVGENLEDADALEVTGKTGKGRPLSAAGKAFLEALTEASISGGKKCRPLADMPEVVAVDREAVRKIFYPRWPADGTAKQKNDIRRQQFSRGLEKAKATGYATTLEVDGVQLVWLLKEGNQPIPYP